MLLQQLELFYSHLEDTFTGYQEYYSFGKGMIDELVIVDPFYIAQMQFSEQFAHEKQFRSRFHNLGLGGLYFQKAFWEDPNLVVISENERRL